MSDRVRLFDRYVVVDWSARSSPATGADSIWIGELGPEGRVALANPPTREAAAGALGAILERADAERLLVGVDASLGYPQGTASLLGLSGTPWRAMWQALAELLVDGPANHNNRFEVAAALNRRAGPGPGPFWGCPPAAAGRHLRPTKPPSPPLAEYRHTEVVLRAAGWQPKSVWQLLGAGTVGGQTLTLLPVLERLRRADADRVAVWPFTTGLAVPEVGEGRVVVAEVWPTRFAVAARAGRVRDAAQVAGTAGALRDADRAGVLAGWFAPEVGAPQRGAVEDEEGWVLGPPCRPTVR